MPIYEYVCKSCGHELEKLQKVSDAPLVKCPCCEKDSLSKQISSTGFRLKGDGWYETDFKSSKEPKRNIATSESKSESKPGSKPESKPTTTESK